MSDEKKVTEPIKRMEVVPPVVPSLADIVPIGTVKELWKHVSDVLNRKMRVNDYRYQNGKNGQFMEFIMTDLRTGEEFQVRTSSSGVMAQIAQFEAINGKKVVPFDVVFRSEGQAYYIAAE